jgi:hypothetical protein
LGSVAVGKRQKLIRRQAIDDLVVYDVRTNQPIGRVENMTIEGVKLITEEPVEVQRVLYCKMELPKKILGRRQVTFDAECRWCKRNAETELYDTGYKLRNISASDKEVISQLVRQWMIRQSKSQNATNVPQEQKKNNFLSRIFQFGEK